MSRKKQNALLCIAALILGCLLYILFRPSTYIGGTLDGLTYVHIVRQICSHYASNFSKYYFPDFLWAFSLGCGLIAIHNPQKSGVIICVLFAFLCGVAWELLQHFNVLNGTGDIHDVIMYLLAGAICIFINSKETK